MHLEIDGTKIDPLAEDQLKECLRAKLTCEAQPWVIDQFSIKAPISDGLRVGQEIVFSLAGFPKVSQKIAAIDRTDLGATIHMAPALRIWPPEPTPSRDSDRSPLTVR